MALSFFLIAQPTCWRIYAERGRSVLPVFLILKFPKNRGNYASAAVEEELFIGPAEIKLL